MQTEAAQCDVRRIFDACCACRTPLEVEDTLQRECGGNVKLAQKVQRLLESDDRASSFLESTPDSFLEASFLEGETRAGIGDEATSGDEATPGNTIEGYKLLQKIGEGGFGVVYMAEQSSPVRRRVALKVIKPGMDSKEVIVRFEAERQALAMMNHPNVAKVLDGGTTALGRPYFVMELVHGTRITKFCDENRLSIRERLRLFVDVCGAIQHAHVKGIIHRDLKPSNVLVTMNDDQPMPKVIDFGVAKALSQPLTERTMFTAYGQMIGTPLYMSPEQAQFSAHDVDVRSDVYSLGVLLYELVTGKTPFDRATLHQSGPDEMRRLIREVDPPRPSARVSTLKAEARSTAADRRQVDHRSFSRSLSGELDWIAMKAIEKDRKRRYQSARELAEDVCHFLDGDAVEACPPTVGYRLKKQAQKHRGLLTALAAIVVVLLAATGLSLSFGIQAKSAQGNAEAEQDKAIAAQQQSDENFAAALAAIVKLLDHASSPELKEVPQSQPIRRMMIEDVLEFYEASANQVGDNEELRHRAAKTWRMLAEVALSLGDFDEARGAFEESLTLVNRLVEQEPGEWMYRKTKIAILHDKSYFHLWKVNEIDEARQCFEDSLAEINELKLGRSEGRYEGLDDKSVAIDEINETMGLANVAGTAGDWRKRRQFVMEAYRLANEPGFDWRVTQVHMDVEMAQLMVDEDPDSAARLFREAIEEWVEIVKENPIQQHKRYQFDTLRRASSFFCNRDPELAERYAAQAVDIVEQQAIKFPNQVEYWVRLWDYINDYIFIVEDSCSEAELRAMFQQYDQYLSREPKQYSIFKHRISVQFHLGNYQQVLADMEMAIEINPEWVRLINRPSPSSIAECPDSEFSEAVLNLADDVVRTNPTLTNARCQRLVLLLAMGRTAAARKDLQFIIEQGEFGYRSGHQMALALLRNGEVVGYQRVCQSMLERFGNSEDPAVQFLIAWTLALSPDAQDEDEITIELAWQAVESSPGNQKYLGGLGATLFRVGEYAGAAEQLRAALREPRDPRQPAACYHYFLAMTEHLLGNQDAAIESLTIANQLTDAKPSTRRPWNQQVTMELLRAEAEDLITE